jgi:hypothetical protein
VYLKQENAGHLNGLASLMPQKTIKRILSAFNLIFSGRHNRTKYWYDNIGNRESATNNGETTTYIANNLNQYTSITNGGLKNLSYDLDGNLTVSVRLKSPT